MTSGQVFPLVRTAIIRAKSEVAFIRPDEISLDTSLFDGVLAMDSIDYVATIVQIEELFGFIAEDEDFLGSSVRTVGDLVDVVQRRLASEGHSGG